MAVAVRDKEASWAILHQATLISWKSYEKIQEKRVAFELISTHTPPIPPRCPRNASQLAEGEEGGEVWKYIWRTLPGYHSTEISVGGEFRERPELL